MTYTLVLTESEIACGITLEAVAEVLPLGAMIGEKFYVPLGTSPALGTAAARAAFAAPARFSHISPGVGFPAYVRA